MFDIKKELYLHSRLTQMEVNELMYIYLKTVKQLLKGGNKHDRNLSTNDSKEVERKKLPR